MEQRHIRHVPVELHAVVHLRIAAIPASQLFDHFRTGNGPVGTVHDLNRPVSIQGLFERGLNSLEAFTCHICDGDTETAGVPKSLIESLQKPAAGFRAHGQFQTMPFPLPQPGGSAITGGCNRRQVIEADPFPPDCA